LFSLFIRTRYKEIPIIINKIVHTTPKTQPGGVIFGFIRVGYQVPIEKELKKDPKSPASWQIIKAKSNFLKSIIILYRFIKDSFSYKYYTLYLYSGIMSDKKYEQAEKEIFKNKLKKLEKIQGRHTELISLYVPNGADRSSVMNQLTQEVNQSSNIKSPTTRKNVQGALRKIAEYLKIIDFKIPDNGIVIFCGNVSEREGRTDLQLYHVVPIKKLNMKTYRCDSSFVIEPLKEMLAPDRAYLTLAVDNKEATTAILEGKKYRIVDRAFSTVPGKIKAGGQSAHRYEHLRLDAANEFYHRIAEHINKEVMPYIEKITGVV